jgi:predicted ATPase
VARIVSEIRERANVEPSPQGADPEEERWRLFQAVVGFLRNASAVQPCVIVLEDLHWADRGTLDLLIHLARNLPGARLLLVGTYRDVEVDRSHPLSAALAELRRASTFRRVLLRGLSGQEVQHMLEAVTGQEMRWAFAEAVHRQTEGNPLFVQEVLRYLVEEGLLVREGGQWHRSTQTPLEMHIPEGLRDVIGKRLSRLSPECNHVLAVAAVIGRDFALETLRLLDAADSDEALLGALEEALRVGVLDDQSRGGTVRFRFSHAFFRQTLYEEIFTPRRLRLHQEVARALERQYSARLDEHAAELAEHFAQSSDPTDLAKAVKYGELAARRALAVYAHGEAVHHWEQAILAQEVLDPDDRARQCDLLRRETRSGSSTRWRRVRWPWRRPWAILTARPRVARWRWRGSTAIEAPRRTRPMPTVNGPSGPFAMGDRDHTRACSRMGPGRNFTGCTASMPRRESSLYARSTRRGSWTIPKRYSGRRASCSRRSGRPTSRSSG